MDQPSCRRQRTEVGEPPGMSDMAGHAKARGMTRHRMTLPVLSAAVLGIAALSWAREPTAPAAPAVRYRVSPREAPRHQIAEGKGSATLLLNASTGAKAASMTLLELGPGAGVPEHVHESSAEI